MTSMSIGREKSFEILQFNPGILIIFLNIAIRRVIDLPVTLSEHIPSVIYYVEYHKRRK